MLAEGAPGDERGHSPMVWIATRLVGASGDGQDRVATKRFEHGCLVVLADGAGGTAGGARAADLVVARALALSAPPDDCCSFLLSLDRELEQDVGCGMTTVVLAFVARSVHGASVGDSEAWLVMDSDVIDLTAAQSHSWARGAPNLRALDPSDFKGGSCSAPMDCTSTSPQPALPRSFDPVPSSTRLNAYWTQRDSGMAHSTTT